MWTGVSLCLLLIAVACASSTTSGVRQTPGSRVIAAKCGACHLLPEAGSVDSNRFNEWLVAHARRVKLSQEEQNTVRAYLTHPDDK